MSHVCRSSNDLLENVDGEEVTEDEDEVLNEEEYSEEETSEVEDGSDHEEKNNNNADIDKIKFEEPNGLIIGNGSKSVVESNLDIDRVKKNVDCFEIRGKGKQISEDFTSLWPYVLMVLVAYYFF